VPAETFQDVMNRTILVAATWQNDIHQIMIMAFFALFEGQILRSVLFFSLPPGCIKNKCDEQDTMMFRYSITAQAPCP
jgi:hypothetical protein